MHDQYEAGLERAAFIAKTMISEIENEMKSGQTTTNEDLGLVSRKAALEELLERLTKALA